jgi:hypothetical protein
MSRVIEDTACLVGRVISGDRMRSGDVKWESLIRCSFNDSKHMCHGVQLLSLRVYQIAYRNSRGSRSAF